MRKIICIFTYVPLPESFNWFFVSLTLFYKHSTHYNILIFSKVSFFSYFFLNLKLFAFWRNLKRKKPPVTEVILLYWSFHLFQFFSSALILFFFLLSYEMKYSAFLHYEQVFFFIRVEEAFDFGNFNFFISFVN